MFLRLSGKTSSSPMLHHFSHFIGGLALLVAIFGVEPGAAQYWWCNGRAAITMPTPGCNGTSVCSPVIQAALQTKNWWNGTNNTVGNLQGVAATNFFTTFAYNPMITITNTNGASGQYSTACQKIAAIIAQLNLWAGRPQASLTYGNATYAATAQQQLWATMIPAWGHTIGEYIACGANCTNFTSTTSTTSTTAKPTTTTSTTTTPAPSTTSTTAQPTTTSTTSTTAQPTTTSTTSTTAKPTTTSTTSTTAKPTTTSTTTPAPSTAALTAAPSSSQPSSQAGSASSPSPAVSTSTISTGGCGGQSPPVVTTATFSVMGTTIAINMSAVPAPTSITAAEIFYGVPYAEPPVGGLRFEKPYSLEPYNGTLNCTTVTNIPSCHNHVDSPAFPAAEDCLKLVIYRPACTTDADRLPVLVWIHGGAYVSGGAFPYAPPYSYAFPNFYVSQGIIVVQVQYRLSLYGFGADGTADFPGNYGLFDQQLALEWISENIDAFGGDNERVTLFGESAGGSSAAYQSIQPDSACYFQQAIQMSGSFNSPWAAPSNVSITSTAAIAAMLNCSSGSSLKACLQAVDIGTLQATLNAYPKMQVDFNFNTFAPTFDNDFIYDDFLTMMEQAEEKCTLIGFNSDESLFLDAWLAQAVPGFIMPAAENFTADDLATLISALIVPSDANNTEAVAQIDCIREELIDFYTYDDEEDEECTDYFYYQQYTLFLSDIQFIIPALWEARAKSQLGWSVALLHNTYLSRRLAPQLPYPAVPHTSDLPYTLDVFDLYAWTLSADDLAVRNYWVNLYVDFIWNGMDGVPVDLPLCYPLSDDGGCCVEGSDHYSALNMQLAPFVEDESTAHSVPCRLDFWDELSHDYDLSLVRSLPNTMGQCVPWD